MIDEYGIFVPGSVKIYALTDTEFIALCNYLPNAPISNLVKRFFTLPIKWKHFSVRGILLQLWQEQLHSDY